MIIPTPHYPQFATATHIEELALQLAREILEQQKTASSNLGNDNLITVDVNETKETATVKVVGNNGITANFVDGMIKCKNYLGGFIFTPGEGSYPFDQTSLVDAFIHVAFYHQFQELNQSINPGEIQCVDYSIVSMDSIGSAQQLSIKINITDLPVIIVNGSATSSKAKPYLI